MQDRVGNRTNGFPGFSPIYQAGAVLLSYSQVPNIRLYFKSVNEMNTMLPQPNLNKIVGNTFEVTNV